MKTVGLRIDVDTLRGTRLGVPALCEELRRRDLRATFYFSVGPDNMGRHLWRLLRPAFLKKMLRSNAPGLYGWDILLMGTAWPGPRIGKRCENTLRACAHDGHETGLHAWDHHKWQSRIDQLRPAQLRAELTRGTAELQRLLGTPPATSAVPGWRCNNETLLEKDALGFVFNSDCRGNAPFTPVVDGKPLKTPQVPVTLPTYDEIIGTDGINNENYNSRLLELIRDDHPNVYTIHAEVEGLICRTMFARLLDLAAKHAISVVPLGTLLRQYGAHDRHTILPETLPGREGWLATAQP